MKLKLKPLKKHLLLLFTAIILLGGLNSSAQNSKIDSLTKSLSSTPEQNDKRANTLFNIAAYYFQSDSKLVLKNVQEILSFQDKIVNKRIVSAAYRVKGLVLFQTSQFKEALENLHNALAIDNKLKSFDGIAGDLGSIGLIHMTQSKYPEALKYYLESLTNFEKTKKNQIDVAATLVNIATIYNEMGDSDKAMDTYQKSYQSFKKMNHTLGQTNTLTNIGIIHFKNNNVKEAIRYSNMALKLADSVKDVRSIARENGNLSSYYSNIKQFDLALNYATKAIDLNKKIGNKKGLGYNYQSISSAYLGKKNYVQSKTYAINALNIGKELNVTEIKRDASLGLSEVYEAIKMADSSLFYFKEYTKFADSITNDKKKNEITKMGIQYEFDKKELTYQQQQLLADQQLKQQQLQLALNYAEIQRSSQLGVLQKIQIENEKLIGKEKEKQLLISKNNEKLQLNKVNALSQQQKLKQLELNQLWLYGILAVVILVSILIYLLNLYRIRQLRFKNTLQSQEAEQKALKLNHQYQLSESELKAIRSQMNPHFIFNVLNSIESYIMDNDKRTASRLVQKFASLSRLILENSTKSLVSGDKEWKALILYTELEAMRYNNSFTYNFIVDEELQLKTLLLPPMLIQPLIENAILHGLIVDQHPDAHLEVEIKKHNRDICITVTDNGVGIESNSKPSPKIGGVKEKSIGLASIKERIEMINQQEPNANSSFEIKGKADGNGTIAILKLPIFNSEIVRS